MSEQLAAVKQGTLTAERKKSLMDIGFATVFEKIAKQKEEKKQDSVPNEASSADEDDDWETHYQTLVSYSDDIGTCFW